MSAPVLVVDDDAGVRYTVREILASAGLAAEEAVDGVEALARCEAVFFPVVITDLRMPRLDGLELVRRLAARVPAPRVVVITAHGSERQAVDAMKAGAWDYFRKPFVNEELLAVVRRAAQRCRAGGEEPAPARRDCPLGRDGVRVAEHGAARRAGGAGGAAGRDGARPRRERDQNWIFRVFFSSMKVSYLPHLSP